MYPLPMLEAYSHYMVQPLLGDAMLYVVRSIQLPLLLMPWAHIDCPCCISVLTSILSLAKDWPCISTVLPLATSINILRYDCSH